MSARDELVSFARQSAHDLTNPVAALTMAVELALDVLSEDNDELADLLRRVQSSADRVAKAVATLPAAAADWPLDD